MPRDVATSATWRQQTAAAILKARCANLVASKPMTGAPRPSVCSMEATAPRLAYRIALVVALVFVAGTSASSQTLGGRVIDRVSKRPVSTNVWLMADTLVVARTKTDTGGVFYLDAPVPGVYRVQLMVTAGTSFLSDTIRLAGEFVERKFEIDVPERTYFEFEVEKQVSMEPGTRGPTYPASMRRDNIEGEVLAQFIVDTTGRARMSTFKVLRSTNLEFTLAVRQAVAVMRFHPAEVGNRKVPQLVQMPFQFSLSGGPP